MSEVARITSTEILLSGMVVIFLLALGLVLFFMAYQRRLQKQHKEHMAKEAAYQQELLRANLLSQERERGRIGKDLHDSVGALLTTARLYFRQMNRDTEEESFVCLKDKAMEILDETMTTVRRVSHDLKPVVLERLGLLEAISELADKVNHSGSLTINYERVDEISMDPDFELNWYRIVQELVQNSLKHAQAKNIWIKVKVDENVFVLLFEDDGVGIADGSDIESGLGMKNIESRLQMMSGDFELNKSEGQGLSMQLQSRLKP